MIRARDALTLAHTKIRSKRLRLLITTIVSALVFGVMAGVSIIADGASKSLSTFARQNLDGQYLVAGQANLNPMTQPSMISTNDPTMIKEVEALNRTYLAERKAAAADLGITDYDPSTEIPAVTEDKTPGVPEEFRRSVNTTSVAYERWMKAKEKTVQADTPDAAAFTSLVKPLGARTIYEPEDLSHLQLRWLREGKEDLNNTTSPESAQQQSAQQTSLDTGMFSVVSEQLVRKYIVPAKEANAAPNGIPILLLPDDVVAAFGKTQSLPKRPKDAAEQVQWFRSLQEASYGLTFTSCFRNAAEQQRLTDARSQRDDIAANKNNADFLPPELQLAMPTTPCGAVTVAKDNRTEEQKAQDAKRAEFEAKFKTPEKPVAEAVTFQIVGLLPPALSNNSGIDALLASVVGVNYSMSGVIPKERLAALPSQLRHDSVLNLPQPALGSPNYYGQPTSFIASFDSVANARAAIRANACGMNWTPGCDQTPFTLATYGTNYLAVDDATTALRPVIWAAFLIAFGIATLIIWAMMGRVIADSRRETAVFRAIGAKRSDIVAVYLTYSLWVALRIVVVAGAIGVGIALLVQVLYAARTTSIAHLAYSIFTDEPRFSFLGFGSRTLWLILGGIVVMSLIAIIPPLLRNIRRNPIRDMRDE